MELTLTRPDDWHVHLRDGAALSLTVPHSAATMGRAIVMPNLRPPVVSAEDAQAYYQRILTHRPAGNGFEPLMTLYLTDNTTSEMIHDAADSGVVKAVKVYPAGATTNSDSGVTDIRALYPVFETMSERGIKLLIHGEVTDSSVDIFEREAAFLGSYLDDIVRTFPDLKVVLEHITTTEAVRFVENSPENLAATITPHHLLFNRNHMLAGGIRPHYYCLPILKKNSDQASLVRAATSGNPRFFLGTDSAPHATAAKESSCGCAGSYVSYAAIELYAMAFELAGALDKLEDFASHFGPDFYGLPRNTDTITLERIDWTVPDSYRLGDAPLTPLLAGETIPWKVRV
ncbi:MAG: dihydroorotase [Myxococcales bacterium]|nr:dihydroorotase [Myxococcales bacterium]|tara:strand:+ start:360 stop:1391 length:1032 start_codon:yes stop_codon:yes gene_type:complete